ncbi:glycosyltransferase family 2 protein [Rubrivirga sp.]|uniref:glycosyltransferase family 2 protein n=1 Tax=Rubrivirga sp. TaxID=1885344 RepID=UPI003B52583A
MTPMSYALVDVELSEPAAAVRLEPDQSGLAVVVRWHGRPCGFVTRPFPPGTTLDAATVGRLADDAGGYQALVERLRSEVADGGSGPPLPAVTLAVCTRGRPDEVARLLGSLAGLEPPVTGVSDLLLVIVDNAPPTGDTRAVVEAFAASAPEVCGRPLAVRYVVEPLPGLDFARNRALRHAPDGLIVYLDDDVVVERSWLAGLAEAYAENPDAGAFTGLVLPLALDTEAQVLFERRGGFRKGFAKRRHGATVPGDGTYPCGAGVFGTGANMAFRVDLVRELGGFDEALDMGAALPGGGDVDMFYRVVRSGRTLVYEPSFAVRHEHRRDRAGLRRQFQRSWGMGTTAFAMKLYATDPEVRPRVRRLLWWWVRHQGRLVRAGITGRGPVPLDMALAELWGGLVGLAGRYPRAQRLAARIRAEHAGR